MTRAPALPPRPSAPDRRQSDDPAGQGVRAGTRSAAETLRPILDLIERRVPDALIDRQGWSAIAERTADLPRLAAESSVGFETRLQDPRPAADFFVWIRPSGRFGEYLLHADDGGGRAPIGPEAIRRLRRAGSTLARRVPWLILEYDVVDAPPGSALAPGVFLTDIPPIPQDEWNPIADILDLATRRTECREERRMLAALAGAVPPGGRIAHLGAMPDRRPRTLRALVKTDPQQTPGFLRQIGWPGAIREFERTVEPMRRLIAGWSVACDVTSGAVAPQLGIELFLHGLWPALTAADWHPLLERLEAESLCRPEKAAALRAEIPPRTVIDERGVRVMRTGINHIKLTLRADGTIGCKAYLGVAFLTA